MIKKMIFIKQLKIKNEEYVLIRTFPPFVSLPRSFKINKKFQIKKMNWLCTDNIIALKAIHNSNKLNLT